MNREQIIDKLRAELHHVGEMERAGIGGGDPQLEDAAFGMVLLKAAARCYDGVFRESDFVAVAKAAWAAR